jgi:hypothetical protein
MRNGIVYPLPTLVPLIVGIESGSLRGVPTPTLADSRNSRRATAEKPEWKSNPGVTLCDYVVMWPTPAASLMNLNERPASWLARREKLKEKGYNGNGAGMPLTIAVQLWPTPTVQDAENDGGPAQFRRKSLPLNAAVKVWPTPTARDMHSYAKVKRGANSEATVGGGTPLVVAVSPHQPPPNGGQLNPTWVEWLMGFPLGWTDCDASAMP